MREVESIVTGIWDTQLTLYLDISLPEKQKTLRVRLWSSFQIKRAVGFFLLSFIFAVSGNSHGLLKDEVVPTPLVIPSPAHSHHELCTKPKGKITDRLGLPARVRKWTFQFLADSWVYRIGPKPALWVKPSPDVVHIWWELEWTKGGTAGELHHPMQANIPFGTENLFLGAIAWFRGWIWPACLGIPSAGTWGTVFDFTLGMRKCIVFLWVAVVSIDAEVWKRLFWRLNS